MSRSLCALAGTAPVAGSLTLTSSPTTFVQHTDTGWALSTQTTQTITLTAGKGWALTVPVATDCVPAALLWTLTLADGSQIAGTVTEAMATASVSAALTPADLLRSYGWTTVRPATTILPQLANIAQLTGTVLGVTGLTLAVATKTANYTLTATDVVVIANASGKTITLPSAATTGARNLYAIINGAAGDTTTVATTSAQTISGAASSTLTAAYNGLVVVSDGANWLTLATL